MHVRRMLAAVAALLSCSGCALIFSSWGKYPPADPIWTAVAEPVDPMTFGIKPTRNQQAASESARAYVLKFFTADRGVFFKNLEEQKLICRPWGGVYCTYTQARALRPCHTPLRVSIEVNFPSGKQNLEERDVDVAAMVFVDHEYKDPYCMGAL